MQSQKPNNNPIPKPTLQRLPSYLQCVKRVASMGRDVVSCTHIAQELKLDPVQVRKDLQFTGIVGSPRIGYSVVPLIDAIEGTLGWNNLTDAFLVGTGSLGTALLRYEGLKESKLEIVAAFDNDSSKIGKTIHGKKVLSTEKLTDLARRMHISIGIIAVPAGAAQQVADMMIAGGVRAIWNFAPAVLRLPPHCVLENTQLSTSLAVLTARLTEAIFREREVTVRATNHEQVGADGPQIREGLRDPGRLPARLNQVDSDSAGRSGGVPLPS